MALWFLDSIEINGGFLAGVSLLFPKGLTCIIGPRGSGKSTLAEAIRFTVGVSRTDSRSTRDLIEKNLVGAAITLRTAAGSNAVAYQIRRSGRQAPTLCTAAGEPVRGVDLERGSFLPLDAYSSNEVEEIADESLGDKRRSLLDDLRADEFARIQVGIADRLRALDANRDAIRLSESMLANLRERIEELTEAPARLAALPPPREGEEAGELARVTKQAQTNQREQLALEQLARLAGKHRQEVQRLAGFCSAEPTDSLIVEGSANEGQMAELETGVTDHLRAAASFLTQAEAELQTVEDLIGRFRERLADRHTAQEGDMDRLQQRNLAASLAMQQRAAAEQSVGKLRGFERQLRDEEERHRHLQEERKALKGAYLLERERVSELRSQIAAQLQEEAGEKVRVRVLRNADSIAFQQILMSGLQGARVRNHEDILAVLMRLRPEDLAQLIHDNDENEFAAQTELGRERSKKVLESFREKIDPMQLEIVPIEDRVCIELNVASRLEPHFKDAAELSRGQKCTALLPLLLARRETPLVIDQPEDNLDNHFIFETIVESIRRIKQRRQMIFITHNANIPVLGDADLVVVLDSDGRKGFVKKSGNVDDCRDEIVDLLEGGKEAFELRRRCYAKG